MWGGEGTHLEVAIAREILFHGPAKVAIRLFQRAGGSRPLQSVRDLSLPPKHLCKHSSPGAARGTGGGCDDTATTSWRV